MNDHDGRELVFIAVAGFLIGAFIGYCIVFTLFSMV